MLPKSKCSGEKSQTKNISNFVFSGIEKLLLEWKHQFGGYDGQILHDTLSKNVSGNCHDSQFGIFAVATKRRKFYCKEST